MRQYDDPVEVRTAQDRAEEPGQFLWRGRLWQVRAVLAHWIETGAWWQRDDPGTCGTSDATSDDPVSSGDLGRPQDSGRTGDLLAEREVWRVEAGRGPGTLGVFDLACRRDDDRWQLVGCLD